MPKFSQQRIIKSKIILSSFLDQTYEKEFRFEEIRNKAINKTKMLLSEDDPNFDNFFKSNLHLLINSSIKMSIPKIRNRFESGYALFRPDDSVIVDKERSCLSFYIFNEREMINYSINRQKTLLEVGKFRRGVIKFYSRIPYDFIIKCTKLSEQDIMDEIEYASSLSNVRYRNDSTYILDALINCNKIVDFMKAVLDDDNKREFLFDSLMNPAYMIYDSISKINFEDNIYYIVPINEDLEINSMEEEYDLKLKK